MNEDRPLGWRPYSEEYRKTLVGLGMTDEAIAEQEKTNCYTPDARVVEAQALAWAMLRVLAKRLGPEVAHDVAEQLQERAKREDESPPEGAVDAAIIREMLTHSIWDEIGGREAPQSSQ